MAFPSVRSQINTDGTTASATPIINLPATIRAGDTIFVDVRVAVAGAIGWPDVTWNELYDASADSADDQQAGAWKKADGSEGGTTITLSSGNGKFRAMAVAVKDATDPSIRAPEVSSANTGVNPVEPVAIICTPTGGAKDYLWLTLFGMEGEQTGITAYPTNYTLGQSGLANSGTGGAVTTNVTGACAARQLNAASEIAAAWDVAGTIDDWTAYTIVFHPAEPIAAPLDRRDGGQFPVRLSKPYISASSFSRITEDNELPKNEYKWPIFSPRKFSNNTILVSLLLTTLAPTQPFNQTDWSNPKLRGKEQTCVNNNLENTLVPIGAAPFSPTDYKNPQHKKSGIGWIDYITLNQPTTPFTPVDYKNPLLKIKPALTWIQPKPLDYIEPTESPCPITLGIGGGYSDITCLVLTGLSANPSPDVPSIQDAQELPIYNRKRALTWIQNSPFYYTSNIPPGRSNYTNVIRRKEQLITSISTIQGESQPVVKPFNEINWPNVSIRKKSIHHGWTDNYTFDTSPLVTSPPVTNQVTYIRTKKGGTGWIDYVIFDTNVPDRIKYTALPPTRKTTQNVGFTRPALLSSPVFTAAPGKRAFDIPVLKKKIALSHLNSSLSVVQLPTNQDNWPNPLVSNKLRIDWIQARPTYYEEPIPEIHVTIPNPLVGKVFDRTWIQIAKLESNPIIISDNPNPLIAKKIAETWIINLLESTLEPTAPEIPLFQTVDVIPRVRLIRHLGWTLERNFSIEEVQPFHQVDWFNPKILKKFDATWIKTVIPGDERIISGIIFDLPVRKIVPARFDYDNITVTPLNVPTLTFNDYPNPIRGKKTAITHISDTVRLITGDLPFRFAEWPVSKKNRIAETWNYNPIIIINIPPGETPFAQNDWKNPARIKRLLFDLTGTNYIVLPQTHGRVICLDASFTEYDLEAIIEEFDLEAKFTEYDLEFGNEECE